MSAGDELWQQSAADTAALIRNRHVSCREVIESQIERIHAVNASVNAVTVDLTPAALEVAEKSDATLAAGGEVGPLHGVPVTVKENIDQAGQATTNGVIAFEQWIARDDSPAVANLRRAGAIIIGRTNTPEFSLRWFTENRLRGRTLNPWDEHRTCGGSSGGAASGVAMGLGAIGLGSDLGGSLRYPAYCCGVSSIKPSLGRVPALNSSAPEERPPMMLRMSVLGPIAREVRDLRLGLAAISGCDNRDPLWHPMPLEGTKSKAALRVAVCADPTGDGVDSNVAHAIKSAAGILGDSGYIVEEAVPPNVSEIARRWGAIMSTEIRTMLEPAIEQHGSQDVRSSLDFFTRQYGVLELNDYMRACADRNRLVRKWMAFLEHYPLVLVPVSLEPVMGVGDDLVGFERMGEILRAQQMLVAVNFLGLPAVAIPVGLAGNVPIGVQIIASRYREDLCLDAASVIEEAVGVLVPRRCDADDSQ